MYKKIVSLLALAVVILLSFQADIKAEERNMNNQELEIFFIHDLHSHLENFEKNIDENGIFVGGVSRIKSLVKKKKAKNSEALFLDGGDFSMGTMYHTVFSSEATELRILGALGVDVTTMGNHEFDFYSEGFGDMVEAALKSGDALPQFVLCNVDWDNMDMNANQQRYKKAFNDYGIKDYVVVEKNGIKIAVFGVFGKDALKSIPTCDLKFKDPIKAAKETVKRIKENENVDMIVCLSHGGTSNVNVSEDEELAKNVSDIDFIISAHTHTVLDEPINYKDTYIVSAGCYGENLGYFKAVKKENGRWKLTNYTIEKVTADIEEDEEIKGLVDSFKKEIDENYFSKFGLRMEQVLTYNPYEFDSVEDIYASHTDHDLGNLISDAFLAAANNNLKAGEEKAVFALVPSGTIRNTLSKGNITVKEVFDMYSLGIGKDKLSGNPLISFYVTGKEVKLASELDASYSDEDQSMRLFISGLEYEYNSNRLFLNKVTDCRMKAEDGSTYPIEDDKLYYCVMDMFSGQMIQSVKEKSKGILRFDLRDKEGNIVTNLEDLILRDSKGNEIKAWVSIAEYLKGFDSIPQIYENAQNRKYDNKSNNIIDLIKKPNRFAFIYWVTAIAAITIICTFIIIAVKKIKKYKL